MIEKLRLNHQRKMPAWTIQGEAADLIEELVKLYTVNLASTQENNSCTGETKQA